MKRAAVAATLTLVCICLSGAAAGENQHVDAANGTSLDAAKGTGLRDLYTAAEVKQCYGNVGKGTGFSSSGDWLSLAPQPTLARLQGSSRSRTLLPFPVPTFAVAT